MSEKKKQIQTGPERRCFENTVQLVTRNGEEDSRMIRGYFAKFNTLSRSIGWGFKEKIKPGAFDDIDFVNDDIVALFNHNFDQVVGRTIGTPKMILGVDEVGAFYEFEAPTSTSGNDLLENVKRGLVQHSSFSWPRGTIEDIWENDVEHGEVRTISKFTRLIDVAPVVNPAYSDTTVDARSMDSAKESYEAWKLENNPFDSTKLQNEKRSIEIDRLR